ncbi:beta-lactamase family protein [Sphingobacterium daejeonense]|uniref:serine hydrolase domain-containing protein n=1 Tax=Sphingobacterium daejeonense TaxID=371142 RepID=UPI0021A28400|nr:serine hydrolase domain-containing protein [Sphingobacterium daejeonense]MCT1530670.1 beta-lactamase family protein [Sphingobacterium daejeonense]
MNNIIKMLSLWISIALLLPITGSAQSNSINGFSPERLQRIDATIQQYIDSNWIKGAAALIQKNDQEVYYKAFGIDAPETAMKKDAIFRIASQTKAITSIAVMILFEEGKFLLDDPISKYIPAFKNPQILDKFNEKDSTYSTKPASREITIRDLLTHTSGIDYAQIGSPQMKAIYQKAGVVAGFSPTKIKLADMINVLGKLPLVHNPGEKFTYSLSIDVLGRLVEVASGQELPAFLKERIFDPLEMNDTYFDLPKDKQNRLVKVYTEDKNSKKVIPWENDAASGLTIDYPINGNGLYAGGAGLVSTLKDYAKFLQMILNKGSYKGKQVLARHTVDMISQNQIGALSLGPDKFGLGFQITTKEGSGKLGVSEGSLSWGGFFGTVYWADPKEQLIGLFFVQQSPITHGELGDKFKVLVYQALL